MFDNIRREVMMRKPTIRKVFCIAAAFLFISLTVVAGDELTANSSPAQRDPVRKITIFYTSDEEGYLEPTRDRVKAYGGSAHVMAALRQRGYRPEGDQSLLLSGGDMWTGPAISTWFQGASTVQVMNAMGYDAAAIGNHEFDFGQEHTAGEQEGCQISFSFGQPDGKRNRQAARLLPALHNP